MKRPALYLFVLMLTGSAFFLMGGDDCGSCGNLTGIDPPLFDAGPTFQRTADCAGITCCEDEDLPFEVGTISIKNTGDTAGKFEFTNTDTLEADPPSGDIAAGETVTIKIMVKQCGWEFAHIEYDFGPVDENGEHTEGWDGATASVTNHCKILGEALVQLGIDPTDSMALKIAIAFCPLGVEVLHSAEAIMAQIPFIGYTDSSYRAALKYQIAVELLQQLYGNTDYPCGDGEFGYTVCPNIEAPLTAGTWLFAFNIFGEDVPLDDPEHTYQFGFVFDSDGDPGNNYPGAPPYSNDFFDDTDLWYSVEYAPSGGWQLRVIDATGGNLTEIPSAARATIMGNTIMLAVPLDEFAVDDPYYRVTAFAHKGDWGMGDDHYWSGDVEPTVADGLDQVTVDLTP